MSNVNDRVAMETRMEVVDAYWRALKPLDLSEIMAAMGDRDECARPLYRQLNEDILWKKNVTNGS